MQMSNKPPKELQLIKDFREKFPRDIWIDCNGRNGFGTIGCGQRFVKDEIEQFLLESEQAHKEYTKNLEDSLTEMNKQVSFKDRQIEAHKQKLMDLVEELKG